MRFEHEFAVDAPSERVWAFLLDVPRMATCIPGASNVTAIDNSTYDATVTARIGPITAKFGCRIAIVHLDHATHIGTVEVAGKDTKLGGAMKAKMDMTLTRNENGSTTVRIVSEVEIMGKIGQYGHGIVAKRADAMLADFATCTRSTLG